MIPRRVWVNLAAFFGLFALLVNWAVRNVLTLDFIERPYTITATFASSPGLRANVEVTYLGVRVGTIDRVQLESTGVVADIDVDRHARLPSGITAAVRRKSAVGEPYIALEPPPGYAGEGPFIDRDDRYQIPVEATTVPLAYGELFTSLDALVAAVDPGSLDTVIHELAIALEGRGPELRRTIENAADTTGTLAARSDLFDALATDLTALTHTLSSSRGAIGSSLDNLALLTGTLAASRAQVETLLAEAPEFGTQVAALLAAAERDIGCLFSDIGPVFATLGTPEHIQQLIVLLQNAGPARDALDAALVEPGEDGADGPYLGGSFVPDVGAAPPAYEPNPELPIPPPLRACDAAGTAAAGSAGDSATAAGEAGPAGDAGAVPPVGGRPEPARPGVAESSQDDAPAGGVPLGTYLLGLAAAAAIVALATVRPWRFVPALARRRDRGPDDEEPAP